MQRIVLGLDPDAKNDALVGWTEQFATETGVSVAVVHVVPRVVLWTISSVQADFTTYLANLRSRLEKDPVERLRNHGIAVTLVVGRGDPAAHLARTASRLRADLIVIGGPDHSALHDVVFGGTARHLEHVTDLPVVVVPLRPVHAHDAH